MELIFPFRGINKGSLKSAQPQGTAYAMSNVAPIDSLDGRIRGGQRAGLDNLVHIFDKSITVSGSEVEATADIAISAGTNWLGYPLQTDFGNGGYTLAEIFDNNATSADDIVSGDYITDIWGNVCVFDGSNWDDNESNIDWGVGKGLILTVSNSFTLNFNDPNGGSSRIKEQTIVLKHISPDFNWVSFNTLPVNTTAANVLGTSVWDNGDYAVLKNGKNMTFWDGSWAGTLTDESITAGQMLKIRTVGKPIIKLDKLRYVGDSE